MCEMAFMRGCAPVSFSAGDRSCTHPSARIRIQRAFQAAVRSRVARTSAMPGAAWCWTRATSCARRARRTSRSRLPAARARCPVPACFVHRHLGELVALRTVMFERTGPDHFILHQREQHRPSVIDDLALRIRKHAHVDRLDAEVPLEPGSIQTVEVLAPRRLIAFDVHGRRGFVRRHVCLCKKTKSRA